VPIREIRTDTNGLIFDKKSGQYQVNRQEDSARDFGTEKGSFSMEYFVYFEKK